MKNLFKLFGTQSLWLCAIVLAAVIGFSFVACENGTTDDNSKNPVVTGVSVTPQTAAIAKGGSQTFTAVVAGENEPSQKVTWTLETSDTAAGTSIDANGKLTIDANETKTEITIKATAAADTSKSATAQVTVTAPDNSITSVTVTPQTATVAKGGSQTFTAVVAGANNPVQTVTWTLETSGVAAGTSIDANGKLTVDANESLNQLTVKAASTVNPSKSGSAAVTLTGGPVPTVTNVTVTPETVSVEKGKTQTFTAVVAGENEPSQTVTWTLETSGTAAGTSIDATGVLTVDKDESLNELTVKAVSTVDTTKSGTATVTLTAATLTWKKVDFVDFPLAGRTDSLWRLVYGNHTWFAFGNDRSDPRNPIDVTAKSTDNGVTWSLVDDIPAIFNLFYRNLFYDGVKWISVSGNTTYTSTDNGITWTETINNLPNSYFWSTPSSITYNGATYVALGGSGTSRLAVSKDCITWTVKETPVILDGGAYFYPAAYGDGRWIVGGIQGGVDEFMLTSTDDGETWTRVDGSSGHLAYGEGTWVTVENEKRGSIKTSTDGLTWTQVDNHPFGTDRFISTLGYGGKTFVAGNGSTIAASTDGKTWTKTNTAEGNRNGFDIISIFYDDGKFFAAGGNSISGYFMAYAVVE